MLANLVTIIQLALNYRSYNNSNEQIICSADIKFSIWYSGNSKCDRIYARNWLDVLLLYIGSWFGGNHEDNHMSHALKLVYFFESNFFHGWKRKVSKNEVILVLMNLKFLECV